MLFRRDAVVVVEKLADGHQLVALLNEPGHQDLRRLGALLINGVHQDDLSVQISGLLDIVYRPVHILVEQVLGIHRPAHKDLIVLVQDGFHHAALGRADQDRVCADGIFKHLFAQPLILRDILLALAGEHIVVIAVGADLAAQLHGPFIDLRVICNVAADLKKGGYSVVFFQTVQDQGAVFPAGAVVKGQRHHGLVRIHRAQRQLFHQLPTDRQRIIDT